MMRKWLEAYGTWVFLAVIVGGFGFLICRLDPWHPCRILQEVYVSPETKAKLANGERFSGDAVYDYQIREKLAQDIYESAIYEKRCKERQQHP